MGFDGIATEVMKLLSTDRSTVPPFEFRSARKQLAELAALPSEWNGPGSSHVPTEVVATVRGHLAAFEQVYERLPVRIACERPWLAASDDGSLGIEWQCQSRRLAITYDASGTVDYYATTTEFEQDGEITSPEDVNRVARWLFTGQWRA